MSVIIETSLGNLTIDLYYEQTPITSKNFIKLCKIKYYNGHLFYNVQPNFIIQTGDPTGIIFLIKIKLGTGKGGSSIYGLLDGDNKRYFRDEIDKSLTHTNVLNYLNFS